MPPIVSEVLRSSGQPLDPNTRTFMESRFDADFSQVRVHSDGQAVASARELQSSAYTVGQDIIFGAGQFAPHAAQGRRLLAHELTHVVQQGQSASTPHHLISSPADTAEAEAGRIAKKILTPSPNLITVKVSAQRTATVQRQASPDEFTFLRKPSLPSITERVSSGEDKDEYLKQQISLSLKQGHFDLKARAQRSVSAGGDLRQLWRTINSSHEFDSLLNRLIYTRYFLKYFTQTWEDRELSDDETAAWLFQIEKAYQREALKPVDEAILRENERARQEYQENVIKQEIAKLQKQEAIRKFPGHIDPRKYPGVIPHGLAPLTHPKVMAVINMLIYFVPVVGQARGIVEAIVGYNLLTREKLGLLDRLLGGLPLAPLALKGGKIVIRGASLVLNTATEKAALILAISERAGKEPAEILALLSRLEKPAARIDTIREARAAIAEGRNLSAAQLKVLKEVDEALQGGKAIPKASAGSAAPLAPVGPAGAAKEFPIPPKPAAPAPARPVTPPVATGRTVEPPAAVKPMPPAAPARPTTTPAAQAAVAPPPVKPASPLTPVQPVRPKGFRAWRLGTKLKLAIEGTELSGAAPGIGAGGATSSARPTPAAIAKTTPPPAAPTPASLPRTPAPAARKVPAPNVLNVPTASVRVTPAPTPAPLKTPSQVPPAVTSGPSLGAPPQPVRPPAPPAGGVGGGYPGGPTPPGPIGGGLRMGVTQRHTIVEAETLIALDRAAQGVTLTPGEQMIVGNMQGRSVIATPTSVGQFNAAGARGTVPVTRLVPHTPAERQAILDDLEAAGVGTAQGSPDRETVADALLAQTVPNIDRRRRPRRRNWDVEPTVPVFATSDHGIINGLFRLSGMDPSRMGGLNVAEYIRYTRGVSVFAVQVQGRVLIVRPLQAVRPRRRP